jgi:hypothetical protein
MKARRTEEVDREYKATTEAVRRAFDKQVRLLIEQGPEYHSLRVHPWPADGPDAMQAYVNKRARFYYYVEATRTSSTACAPPIPSPPNVAGDSTRR